MTKRRDVPTQGIRHCQVHGCGRRLVTRSILSASALLTVAVAFGTFSAAAATADYFTYQNARFGFSIQYPLSFRWSESDNGDGVWFDVPREGADFRAWAGFNALDQSGAQLFHAAVKEIAEAGVVMYASRRTDGFVVSGLVGTRVRYERALFLDDRGHPLDSWNHIPTITATFWAEYPASRKGELDPIVSMMSRSLRAGTPIG